MDRWKLSGVDGMSWFVRCASKAPERGRNEGLHRGHIKQYSGYRVFVSQASFPSIVSTTIVTHASCDQRPLPRAKKSFETIRCLP